MCTRPCMHTHACARICLCGVCVCVFMRLGGNWLMSMCLSSELCKLCYILGLQDRNWGSLIYGTRSFTMLMPCDYRPALSCMPCLYRMTLQIISVHVISISTLCMSKLVHCISAFSFQNWRYYPILWKERMLSGEKIVFFCGPASRFFVNLWIFHAISKFPVNRQLP